MTTHNMTTEIRDGRKVRTTNILLSSLSSMPRFVWISVLCAAVLHIWLCAQPIEAIDDVYFPDDTYYCMDLARSIAQGRGPVSGSTVSNGYQPLYVAMLVPIFYFSPNLPVDSDIPMRFAVSIMSAFHCSALIFFLLFLRRYVHSTSALFGAGMFWAFYPLLIQNAMNGMETGVAIFFVMVTLWYYSAYWSDIPYHDPTRHQYLILGLLIGLSMLARMDAGMMALTLAGGLLFTKSDSFGLLTMKHRVGRLTIVACTAFVVVLPWWVYSYSTSGLFLQISGQAVRFMSQPDAVRDGTGTFIDTLIHTLSMVGESIERLWKPSLPMMLLGVVCIVLLRWQNRFRWSEIYQHIKQLRILVLVMSAYYLAYCVYVNGYWFFQRYLGIVIIAEIAIVTLLCDKIMSNSHRYSLSYTIKSRSLPSAIFYGAICLSFALLLTMGIRARTYRPIDTGRYGYADISRWIQRHVPMGVTIGAMQSGAIGYYGQNYRIVNLDGVVNEAALDALSKKTLADYVAANQIEYIIDSGPNSLFMQRRSINSIGKYTFEEVQTIPVYSWTHQWRMYRLRNKE